MKNKLLFILLLLSFGINAQIANKNLEGSWLLLKEDMLDGTLFNGKFVDLMMSFKDNKNLDVESKDSKIKYSYQLKDSALAINSTDNAIIAKYKIQKLSPYELIICESIEKIPNSAIIRQHFIKTNDSFKSKMNQKYVYPYMRIGIDTTIQMSEYAFPYFGIISNADDFNSVQDAGYEYIERRFLKLSKAKKGVFRFSFVLNKEGKIEAVNISESSEPRFNDFLADAIYASEKKWRPVVFEDHLVNCQIKYEFNYEDISYETEEEKNIEKALKLKLDKYYDEGMEAFNTDNYTLSITNFSKLLEIKPLAHEVRAYRAASYLAQKKTNSACIDWLYLKNHGVSQSNSLLQKYCN